MAFKLSDFASAFRGGGARSSLFEVSLSGSAPAGNLSNLKFLCRATTIPPSNIAPIDVPFLGRAIKVAGDRTFEPWSITILNDEDFAIRNVLEAWMNQIKSHQGIRQSRSSISGYQRNMVLTQYTKNAKKSQEYTFVNAWPSSVSEISLAWDAPAVEEFTCTWNYDYWLSNSIKTTTVTRTADDGTITQIDYSSTDDGFNQAASDYEYGTIDTTDTRSYAERVLARETVSAADYRKMMQDQLNQ